MSSQQEDSDNKLLFADRLLGFLLAARWWILLVIALLTIAAVQVVFSTEFSPSLAKSFVDNEGQYLETVGLEEWFKSNPDSLVYVGADESGDPWESRKLLSIRRAADEIAELEYIQSVKSIADLPTVDFQASGIRATTQRSTLNANLKQGKIPDSLPSVEAILPKWISDKTDWTEEQLDRLTGFIAKRNEFGGSMLSRSGHAHLMLIEVESLHELSPGIQTGLFRDIQDILAKHGVGDRGRHFSGMLALQAASLEEIDVTLFWLLPVGVALVGLMVFVLFRRFEPIIMILIIAAISVFWGIGFGDWLYGSFSVLVMAVPLMVVVISTGDNIHLVSAYCADLDKGFSHEEALRKTFREMSSACALTSLTTFVGFSSLGLVPSQTIRQFGISAAVGVASALVLSVVLVPIFLDFLHRIGWSLQLRGRSAETTQQVAQSMASFGTRFPALIILGFAALLAAAIYYTSGVNLDPDIYRRFRASHPVSEGTDFFINEFGSISTVELVLLGDRDVLLAPETLRSINVLSDELERDLDVERVDSVARLITALLQRVDFNNPDGVPESSLHTQGVIELLRATDPELVASMITEDEDALRLVAHVPATSYLELRKLTTAISQRAREQLPASLELREKGSAPLIGNAVREIIKGHMYGFVVSFIMILGLISLGLRSLRMGLIAVPTNLIPLLSLGGLLGFSSGLADSDILGVATLGLGLAVDDTIHFLSRYRRELRATQDVSEAIRGTVQHTGVAIVRTTTILTIGFLPFAASAYYSINMLGTFLVAILLIALLADLLLLPALVKVFGPRKA